MKIVYKKVGETPLECINRHSIAKKKTYVGRLDPLAEGLLVLLEDEECTSATEYRSLDKVYQYSFILGVATDTYDLLGKITRAEQLENEYKAEVTNIIKNMVGPVSLPYPPYSSKTVDGVPLFEYAKKDTLHTIQIPERKSTIHEHTILNATPVTTKEIQHRAIALIKKVAGDFRQEESIASWEKIPTYNTIEFSATVAASAGTYVRAIVHSIGQLLEVPAVTTHIRRIQVGQWDSVGEYPSPQGQ